MKIRVQKSTLYFNFLRIIGIFIPFVVWWIAAEFRLLPYLPFPQEVIVIFKKEYQMLFIHTGVTALRALSGFLIGASFGILIALIIAWSRYLFAILNPIILLIRPIPVLALIPIFILWFGIGEMSKIYYIALTCFFIVVIFSTEAIKNVPHIYSWAAMSLGLGRGQIYRRVTLPTIIPGIIGGLRVAITAAPMLTLAAELIGAMKGLGFYMSKAENLMRLDRMVASVILLTLIAVAGDMLMRIFDIIFTGWSERGEHL